MNKQYPFLVQFPSIGDPSLGYLSVAEQLCTIPFEISRVYWTYYTPHNVIRGGHANIDKELLLVSVAGVITVTTEMQDAITHTFILDHPSKGLYLPRLCWHTMQYSENAVQMVIASNLYSEDDYIRDYSLFKSWK